MSMTPTKTALQEGVTASAKNEELTRMTWLDAPHDVPNDKAHVWAQGWNAARAALQQRQAPAQAETVNVEKLARYAPDRSGMNMEQCYDGAYVLLSDVQDAIYSAQQAEAVPVASAEPTYQVWMHGVGGWRNATKDEYDRARPEDRQLCAAPVAQAAPAPADLNLLRDMLAIQEACGLHTDEYAPGSVIEYIKELEADGAAPAPVA